MNNNLSLVTNKPLLQWIGGKRWCINLLDPVYIPAIIHEYHEPFIGGGSIWVHIQNTRKPFRCFISDKSNDLVNFYQIVKEKPRKLIKYLIKLRDKRNRNMYFSIRQIYNDRKAPPLLEAALFYYLSRCSWRGMFRYNKSGKLNMPPRSRMLEFAEDCEIIAFSHMMQNTEVENRDFRYLLSVEDFPENTFVVLDPPYYKNFTGYTGDNFSEDDQRGVREVMDHLTAKGVMCLAFNSNEDFVKALFRSYTCLRLPTQRSIGNKTIGSKAKQIYELAFVNYEPSTWIIRKDRML